MCSAGCFGGDRLEILNVTFCCLLLSIFKDLSFINKNLGKFYNFCTWSPSLTCFMRTKTGQLYSWSTAVVCRDHPAGPGTRGHQSSYELGMSCRRLFWSVVNYGLQKARKEKGKVQILGVKKEKDSWTGRLPFRIYYSLLLCSKPQAALRIFPHSLSKPTAHSGVRLEKNDPETYLLLCQKQLLEAVIQSAVILTALEMLSGSTLRVPILMTAIQKYMYSSMKQLMLKLLFNLLWQVLNKTV